jgi:hypothetical protein
MISVEELSALEAVVKYILDNEYISFCEWVDEGGEPSDHIYGKAMMLDDFVRGVYSTGSVA